MQSQATSVKEYIAELPSDRVDAFLELRKVILDNLPSGFVEEMSYGFVGYVVPHSLYPSGYHCNPKLPLPFLSIANQKQNIAFYHMGIYAMPDLLQWFTEEYPKYSKLKLNMGKSCIRFRNPEKIPFELLGELVTKISVQQWIDFYEKAMKP